MEFGFVFVPLVFWTTKMPKVIFDNRESALWMRGKSSGKDPSGVHCQSIPYGWKYDQWRKEVSDAIYTLAGHMGGFGIDLTDQYGRSLSQPELELDFTYQPPDQVYRSKPGCKMITINDLKGN